MEKLEPNEIQILGQTAEGVRVRRPDGHEDIIRPYKVGTRSKNGKVTPEVPDQIFPGDIYKNAQLTEEHRIALGEGNAEVLKSVYVFNRQTTEKLRDVLE